MVFLVLEMELSFLKINEEFQSNLAQNPFKPLSRRPYAVSKNFLENFCNM